MKVLFVVTAFYPEQAIGAIRVTKFAKYLTRLGANVSVISLSPPPWAKHDETLRFKELSGLEWDAIDQSSLFRSFLQKARVATIGSVSANSGQDSTKSAQSLKSKIRNILHVLYSMAKAIDWSARVTRHAKRKYKDTIFDVIFCSYPSLASPLTGAKLKAMGMGHKLAVDFRDPMAQLSFGPLNIGKYIQNYLLRNTDLTFHVSEGVMESVLGEECKPNDLVLSNGFDKDDIFAINSESSNSRLREQLRFVYTGSMYGGKRDFSLFFEALSSLSEDKNFNLKKIVIEYAGSDGDVLNKQAQQFDLNNQIIDHGQLSRAEAITLQQQSDICLLATWNSKEEQGVLTGKVFEYFMLRKPILSIVGGELTGSEISKVINKTGAGHCSEVANPDAFKDLKAFLKEVMTQKIKHGELISTYNSEVDSYNIKNITESLYKALLRESSEGA